MAVMTPDLLKFVALDAEDLAVVSAHLQDAVVCSSEILWRPQEQRVVIAVNRFDWEGVQNGQPEFRRRRAALRFERVRSCKYRDIEPVQAGKDAGKGQAVLNLLAVEFSETDAPSGFVILTFSGGPALRLEVECLEAELADLGPTWATARCPGHPDSGATETV
jgi:hypothetical protein